MVQLVVSAVIVWAILISHIHLVVSVWLIGYLLKHGLQKTPAGRLLIAGNGKLIWNKQDERFMFAEVLFRPLCLVIHTQSKTKIIVWRDSCREEGYRHLLVVISGLSKDKYPTDTTSL